MRNYKNLLSFIFILTVCFTCLCFSSAAVNGNISEFSVSVQNGENPIAVNTWNNGNYYYLFMPSDVELSELTVGLTAEGEVFLDSEPVTDGDTISLTANTEYTLSCGGNEYILSVIQSASLPSVHITTESGSMDAVHSNKSHKEKASIVIASQGEVILENELDYIKGRGNASWTYVKKPYNIKFDKKTDLFGMGKAKKWSLLANYVDNTLMRNHTALDLAQKVNIPFTSNHIFVDLYINSEYYGNYFLCESVEVGENRVDIYDLEGATEDANADIDIEDCPLGGAQEPDFRKLLPDTQKWVEIPDNPEDITGGYLLEYELPNRYVYEISGFVTSRNQTIVVKAPEYASQAQVEYISSLYQEFEDAVYSESGYNSLGKHYSEYIDIDSFAKMYVFQEFVKNLDAGITSFYIYKNNDSDKFVAAPVWDFDRALGDIFYRFEMNTGDPEGWWSGIIYHWDDNAIKTLPTILNALYRQDDFFALASLEWQNVYSPVFSDEYFNELYAFSSELTPSAVMDSIRWNSFSTVSYTDTAEAYRNFVDSSLIDFISGRKAFLDKGFSDSSVRIFYNANGGTGNMYNNTAVLIGDTITLPSNIFTHSSMMFDSWNTLPDGSGTSYLPGDVLTADSAKIILYAQWKEIPEEPTTPPSDEPGEKEEENLNFFQRIWKKIREFFLKIFSIFS